MIGRFLTLSLLCGSVAGCASRMAVSPWNRVPHTVVTTDGVRIMAVNESFRFEPGQMVSTPYWTSQCPDTGTDRFGEAESFGAQRVLVDYPGVGTLHGILALCPTSPGYQGPAARIYQIQVPRSYVDATSEGRVSVVFEHYDCDQSQHQSRKSAGGQCSAWILWLARNPLPAYQGPIESGASPGSSKVLGRGM
jgi:hypothetical protein